MVFLVEMAIIFVGHFPELFMEPRVWICFRLGEIDFGAAITAFLILFMS